MEELEKCPKCAIFFDPFIWVGFNKIKCPECGHVFVKVIKETSLFYPPFKSTNNDVLEIGSFCKESYSCKHKVKINGENHKMLGVEIYKWFKDNGFKNIPDHFCSYN